MRTGVSTEPLVWIVDCEHWPRAYLRAELIERGFDAVGFVALDDALVELSNKSSRRPVLIVLELRGQNIDPNLLNQFSRAGIPIIALGGRLEMDAPAAAGHSWAAIFMRPFSLGEVAAKVEELVAGPGSSRN